MKVLSILALTLGLCGRAAPLDAGAISSGELEIKGIEEPSGGSQMPGYAVGSAVTRPSGMPSLGSAPLSLALGNTFTGFDFADNATQNGGFLFIPPDPIGAAGTDRLIAVVNAMIEARKKDGTLLWRSGLKDFFTPQSPVTPTFQSPVTYTFDPKVIYDQYEDRFVVVTLERVHAGSNPNSGNQSKIFLAVSKTGTPASATSADWNYHKINAEESIGGYDHWVDYPGFAVDEEAVYLAGNMFGHVGGSTHFSVRLWIIDKGKSGGFYDGGPASFTVHNPYAGGGLAVTTQPAHVFGTSGAGQGIGTYLVWYSGLTRGGVGGQESVQVVRVDDPLDTPTFTQEFVGVGDIEDFEVIALPDAPQSGTAALVEVNNRRALHAVWRDDALWLTATLIPNSGPDAGQTTAHWFKLNTSAAPGGDITLADQGNIGGEDIAQGTYTFFPTVAVNAAGDAMFGFSASASSIYPGAYAAGRQVTDAPGTVQASATVQAGLDYYVRTFGGPSNRWGDYSGISLDPTDDNVFWVFNEFADLRGAASIGEEGWWGTAWASVTLVRPPVGFRLLPPVAYENISAGDRIDIGVAAFDMDQVSGATIALANPVGGWTVQSATANASLFSGISSNGNKTLTLTALAPVNGDALLGTFTLQSPAGFDADMTAAFEVASITLTRGAVAENFTAAANKIGLKTRVNPQIKRVWTDQRGVFPGEGVTLFAEVDPNTNPGVVTAKIRRYNQPVNAVKTVTLNSVNGSDPPLYSKTLSGTDFSTSAELGLYYIDLDFSGVASPISGAGGFALAHTIFAYPEPMLVEPDVNGHPDSRS